MGWIGTAPNPESEFVNNWRCTSVNNRPQWCNPAFDALLDEAAVTVDPVARLAKVKQAEALVLDEAAIIPLYAYTQKNLVRPYVRGYAQNLIAQPPLWRVWLDPDWKRAR
jgi:oligopeptide transport system substrate-binding protein